MDVVKEPITITVTVELNEPGGLHPRNVLDSIEREIILEVLHLNNGNITHTADMLGQYRTTIQRRLARRRVKPAARVQYVRRSMRSVTS